MNKEASEMLKKECCGNHYNTLTGKADVIAMVEKLECDNETLRDALRFAVGLPYNMADEESLAPFLARKACL